MTILLTTPVLLVTALAASAAPAPPATPLEPGVSLTVYSSADPAGFDPQQFIAQQRAGSNPNWAWQVPGFGVVKEQRNVTLKGGAEALRFADVAAFIDPTTVSFVDLTDPQTSVFEQNFEFDLVSPEKLLEKYLDKEVHLVRFDGDQRAVYSGTLLSAVGGQLVLRGGKDGAGGLQMIPQEGTQISLGELPGGLITKPTLVWKINGGSAGDHLVRTTYQTGGITWKSDYNLVLSDDESSADVAAWVTLLNVSGAAYPNATLKLVAGEVQRIQSRQPSRALRAAAPALASMADGGFEEKSFFEYHLYTLPRKTDILANTTQQITLFPTASGVPVQKELLFDGASNFATWGYGGEPYLDRAMGATSEGKTEVFIKFVNDEKSKLGKPLPRGKVRLYKQDDADGTLEFLGEDLIDHTPRNEKVRIRVGKSFDVVGERKQTDFTVDTARRTMTETFRIEIRNRKDVPQKVVVREYLFRWAGWEIVKSSQEFRKVDARTIEFDVEPKADGTAVVEYTVKYTW
jgi:hypothetical protein